MYESVLTNDDYERQSMNVNEFALIADLEIFLWLPFSL